MANLTAEQQPTRRRERVVIEREREREVFFCLLYFYPSFVHRLGWEPRKRSDLFGWWGDWSASLVSPFLSRFYWADGLGGAVDRERRRIWLEWPLVSKIRVIQWVIWWCHEYIEWMCSNNFAGPNWFYVLRFLLFLIFVVFFLCYYLLEGEIRVLEGRRRREREKKAYFVFFLLLLLFTVSFLFSVSFCWGEKIDFVCGWKCFCWWYR